MQRTTALISILLCVPATPVVQAQHTAPSSQHSPDAPAHGSCRTPAQEGFDNIQVETSDITLHERFFEAVLHASVIQRLDHPLTDHIRAYCYRGVVVVVRHDLRTPRPTGWVQLNFTVRDVAAMQQELESASRSLGEEEREKIVRFRRKPDVMRGHRQVDRLEVYGPEGFLIGFDQPHEH